MITLPADMEVVIHFDGGVARRVVAYDADHEALVLDEKSARLARARDLGIVLRSEQRAAIVGVLPGTHQDRPSEMEDISGRRIRWYSPGWIIRSDASTEEIMIPIAE